MSEGDREGEGGSEGEREGGGRERDSCLLACLLACLTSPKILVYLRDGSPRTVVCAATLR